jgi:hypothetical protein
MRSVVTSVSSASTPVQGMDQLFLEVFGRHRRVGDLAQRHDRVLIVVALYRYLAAGRDHARAVAGEQNEVEPVFDLVDAIFDGNSGHWCCSGAAPGRASAKGTSVPGQALGIVPRRQVQDCFPK